MLLEWRAIDVKMEFSILLFESLGYLDFSRYSFTCKSPLRQM